MCPIRGFLNPKYFFHRGQEQQDCGPFRCDQQNYTDTESHSFVKKGNYPISGLQNQPSERGRRKTKRSVRGTERADRWGNK